MRFTLDPRFSIFLSIGLAAIGFMVALPDWSGSGIDPATVKHIVWWGGVVGGIGNIINAALAGVPSKNNYTGFIIKAPGAQPPPS